MAASNGAPSVCACVCHPEHILVKLNDSIPHFLRISKPPAQHIKQRQNIIIEPQIGSYTWERLCCPFATCESPEISSLPHPEGEPCITTYQRDISCTWAFFALPPAGLFSVAGRAGGPREHRGASVGPGRGPRHVLWGFEVGKTGK